MIANSTLKAAIVEKLQANAALTSQFPDGVQGVREVSFRGNLFGYPNVRVEIETQTDSTPDSNCTPVSVTWSVFSFSEIHSSKQSDDIAGLVANYLQNSGFTYYGVRFVRVQILELVPAVPEDNRTWRAQVRCRSTVYET